MAAKALLLFSLPSALGLRIFYDPPPCSNFTAGSNPCHPEWRCGFTAKPSLCTQGSDRWSREELVAALPEFARVFKSRPANFTKNINGMDASHAFSLWFTVSRIKPEWIIESGVYRGFGTWLMRKAAPDAHIVSLDPDYRLLRDRSQKTQYFVGKNFQDFGKMNWHKIIPKESLNNTLLACDDHMSALRRLREMLGFGMFGHIWFDDNEQDRSYSFNKICAPPTEETVRVYDNFNELQGRINLTEHAKNREFVKAHMETYFEFPALIDRCYAAVERGTGLVKTDAELVALGLPRVVDETYEYAHNFPPYVKLRA